MIESNLVETSIPKFLCNYLAQVIHPRLISTKQGCFDFMTPIKSKSIYQMDFRLKLCTTTFTFTLQDDSLMLDRLSNLPVELLIRILSLLPTKDAVVTCSLSSRIKRVIFLERSSIPSAYLWFFSQFLGFHVKVLVCSFLLCYYLF